MANYEIKLTATITQYVKIEADSEEEATAKLREMHMLWSDISAAKFELDDFTEEFLEED